MPSLREILTDPNYVNANPATKEAIFNKYAPQDENYTKANQATQDAIRQRFGLGGLQQQVAAQEETTVSQDAPDFMRGVTNILPQIKEAYYGSKILGTKAIGDKEALAQAVKDYGEVSKQSATKESDSFTKAWEMGIGTVIGDWLPYQIGAGVGSLAETLAFMGLGSVTGAVTGAGVAAVPGAVAGAVSKTLLKKGIKEAAEKIIKESGEEAAQAFIQKEAKKALKSMGATAGIAAQSAMHGAGEVTGRAVQELEKQGKTAEDLDMSRVVPAAIVHGVADFVSDKIALGALKGLSGKSTDSFIKDVVKAVGVTGLKETPPETIQTIAERYGASLSLTDAEALKEYIDTAAASFGMSVIPGGVGGVRTYVSGKRDEQKDAKQDEIKDVAGTAAETEGEAIVKDPAAQVEPGGEVGTTFSLAEDAADPAAVTQDKEPADIKTPAAPEDPELAAMKAEYAERQAKIAAGGPKKQVENRIKANEELAKKIAAKEAELAAKKPAEDIDVTEATATAVDTTKDSSTPTPPTQFDAAAFQKKIDAMTDEQIQDDVEIGFWAYTDEQLALLEAELARRKAGKTAQQTATEEPPTADEQAALQAELDAELGQTTTPLTETPKAKRGKKAEAAPVVSEADEIIKLGFMDQPSYHSNQAPPDVETGVKWAATDAAYDTFDTVDIKDGIQPAIDYAYAAFKKANPGTKVKKTDLQSYMSDEQILNLYKENAGKKAFDEDQDTRQAYASVRDKFVNSLDPNQRALYNAYLNNALLKEIVAKKRRGQKRTRATGYTRQEVLGKRTRQAKKDIQEQVEEAKVDEDKAVETVTQAAIAESSKERSERKVSEAVEKVIGQTDNLETVLDKIADPYVNEWNTRKFAAFFKSMLKQSGLLQMLQTKIVFGDVEGNNDGKFDPANNVIVVRGQNGKYTGKRRLDQVVIHEVSHSLLDHIFDNKESYLKSITDPVKRKNVQSALNRLDNNYKFVKARLGKSYNIGTMKEFLAEFASNSDFQIDVANLQGPSETFKPREGREGIFTAILRNILQVFGFAEPKEHTLFKEILEDFSEIISLPTPELQGATVSYSSSVPPPTPPTQTPKNPRKKAEGLKPSRDNDLNDNTGYEIAEYQHPRSLKGMVKLAREAGTWRVLAQKFQNDRYPIKRWEEVFDGAKKIFYEGIDKINNIYTQITLSTSRAKNYYNRFVKPAHEELDNAVAEFAKATGKNTDQALGFIHRLLEALHEPERRRVKYILSVPLSTDPRQGVMMDGKPVSAADARARIVELLDTKALTDSEARQYRAFLDSLIDTKKPDGNPKYIDPMADRTKNGESIPMPKTAEQAAAIVDPNNVLYNVIGLGSEKETAQEVVAKRLQQYQKHPQKAEIDRILNALRQFNGPNGITASLSKYANYWSDFVSNRVAFYGFQNYAPFKGKSKFDTHSAIDELLDFDSIKMGRELQDAAYAFDGRTTVSDNPVLQTVSDAIRASMRAGRKELTQAIKNSLEKSKENPNGQGILKGNVKATIPFKDRMNKEIINKYKGEGTIFHYNKDGSIDILFVEDPKLRNAIRRTYKDTNPFTDMANRATSTLGKMHTRWNYNFAPLNFVRDVITNAWAIGAEMGPKEALRFAGQIASKVVMGNVMPKAMRVAALYQKGGEESEQELKRLAKKDPVYADMVEFIKEGGMVSYLQGLSIRSNFEELQKDMGRSGIMRNVEQLNKLMDIWVEMFELASRSAAYKIAKQNAIAKGVTEAEAKTRAATYAKNLANFEQVGEWGKTMGAFFMFFRPSATGAVRAIEAAAPAFRKLQDVEAELPEQVRNDPEAKAAYMEQYAQRQKNARVMTSALVGLGMVTYVMASMMSDDDDLGRNEVLNDNMDQWTRFARFHIPKALTGDKEYTIQIPWGFGLGAFAASGAQLMSVMYGKQSLPDALANIFLQISLDSFVPLPVSRMSPADNGLAFAIDSLTPSMARPLVEFLINKNGLGQDIYNDANRRMGDAYMGGDKIPEIYKTVAADLANATLGAIDWSPNSIYFLANSYADGIARLFEYGYGMTTLAAGEKSFNPKTDLALIGSFFGSRSSVDTREFTKVEKEIQEKERRINMFEANPEKYVEYLSEYPLDVALVEYYNEKVGNDLKVLQTQAKSIRLNQALAPIDKESLLKVNKLQQNLIKHHMIQAISAYGVTP